MRQFFGKSHPVRSLWLLRWCGPSILWLLVSSCFICASPHAVGAKDEKVSSKISTPTLEQAYYWYDGEKKRKVWLNPHLIAEFITTSENQSPVKSAFGSRAIAEPGKLGSVIFWRIEGLTSEEVLRKLKADSLNGQLSPVFHDTSSEFGFKRALPGNIIVYFKSSWNDAQVNQWASAKDLEIIKKLTRLTPAYVLKTAPGLETLERANAIYESGEVRAAMPNWWMEFQLR